ncbi:MAG: hypothetical protein HUU20_01030 [Pirellulales bacterium]|nr:hypothetical protein [Pirellulales bacterium]
MSMLPLLAQAAIRTTFEWGRIQSNADWILPVAVAVLLALFVRSMYRRDAAELSPWLRWVLTGLRVAVLLVLFVLYLQPQWRTQREEVLNSRAILLVDTSLSMGLNDLEESGDSRSASRSQQVAGALRRSDLLDQLRKVHDVVVMRFDEETGRVASLGKLPQEHPERPVASAIANARGERRASGKEQPQDKPDWERLLAPTGTETRLGQSLRELLYEERNAPVAGIVVFSDGGQNAGSSPDSAVELAREAKIPVFTVGIGSKRQPGNVRVYELECPERTQPGDPYTVTGLIQAQEMAGKSVTVQLLLRPSGRDASGQPGAGKLVAAEQVVLGSDGEVVPVKFQLNASEPGRQTLCLRVLAPRSDHNPKDDFRESEIEIVNRKTRVLLFAGGPTREYGFLRTMLFRDKSVTVDVLLETGQPGMSQEADTILEEFPSTREAMFAYDCVIAFDPNWKELTSAQVDLLEQWIAEQGGGLIAIAGPVYAGDAINGWVQDQGPALAKVRTLYPVHFQRRFSVLESGTYTSKEPWPLEFGREGMESEFLWLEDTSTANQRAWAGFPGVYGFYPVEGPRAGATVYATFSDPRTAQGGDQPVFMAGQFYGSGRSFYLGSGEMWRLRQVDPAYFEKFYAKLVRHVSQGRLLRQSSRGVLMLDRDRYLLGSTVQVRAQLTNAQLDPLSAAEVPLEVFQPDSTVQPLTLTPDPSRAGMFVGQLTVLQEGAYRLELSVPESDERLLRRIQVALPDLERENPRLNDKLLMRIAEGSQGKYYQGLEQALSTASPQHLVAMLPDRTRTIIRTAAPDRRWEAIWRQWVMFGFCGLLFSEWLIRRLAKLA